MLSRQVFTTSISVSPALDILFVVDLGALPEHTNGTTLSCKSNFLPSLYVVNSLLQCLCLEFAMCLSRRPSINDPVFVKMHRVCCKGFGVYSQYGGGNSWHTQRLRPPTGERGLLLGARKSRANPDQFQQR